MALPQADSKLWAQSLSPLPNETINKDSLEMVLL